MNNSNKLSLDEREKACNTMLNILFDFGITTFRFNGNKSKYTLKVLYDGDDKYE